MIDSELFYVFGLSAIGVASIAYIFFGFSPDNSKSCLSGNTPIRGLKNAKNNCFINSILQSISNSDYMIEWLMYAGHTIEFKGKVINQIIHLVKNINRNENYNEVLSPHDVLNALRSHKWIFTNEEQDAYEFFNVLTSTLDNELNNNAYFMSIRNIFDSNSSIKELSSKIRIKTRTLEMSTIPSCIQQPLPTRGILATHLICRKCQYKYPLHLDIFDSIPLSLPPNSLVSSISLENCLSNFVSIELIEDFMCESCKCRSTFDKKMDFLKLPKLLCLHLQRLLWSTNDSLVKRVDHVFFPELLNMDPYVYVKRNDKPEQSLHVGPVNNKLTTNINQDYTGDTILQNSTNLIQNFRYKFILNSVIVHLGGSSSGHFICYRKQYNPVSRKVKWYYTSDLIIREVPRSEVFSCSAYMLFYERVSV